MSTISKRVTSSGETTYQAKVRRKGMPTQSRTFGALSDAKKWARKVEQEMDQVAAGLRPPTAPRDERTVGNLLVMYDERCVPHQRGKHTYSHREFSEEPAHKGQGI